MLTHNIDVFSEVFGFFKVIGTELFNINCLCHTRTSASVNSRDRCKVIFFVFSF